MNTIGDRIRTARIDRHLTQQQVADALNVTNKAVSKWETCEALPETAQLVPLCDVLGLTVDELLGDPDRQKPQEGVLPQKDWLNMTNSSLFGGVCRCIRHFLRTVFYGASLCGRVGGLCTLYRWFVVSCTCALAAFQRLFAV